MCTTDTFQKYILNIAGRSAFHRIIDGSPGIVYIHTDKEVFDCLTVIIIVLVLKHSLDEWMCCVYIWINSDGFDLAVRLKEELESITVRSIYVSSRYSPPALKHPYL